MTGPCMRRRCDEVAVSVLSAVVLGLGVYLLNRLDKVSQAASRIETDIGALQQGLTALEKKVDEVSDRLADLEKRVSEMGQGIARLEGPM